MSTCLKQTADNVKGCLNCQVIWWRKKTLSSSQDLNLASFPDFPRARTKNRRKGGEPGRIHHVRNVIGRENLITCGRTTELAHPVRTEYSCDSSMADRMGLDGTMLYYLVVRKLWWAYTIRIDRCTSRRMVRGEGSRDSHTNLPLWIKIIKNSLFLGLTAPCMVYID